MPAMVPGVFLVNLDKCCFYYVIITKVNYVVRTAQRIRLFKPTKRRKLAICREGAEFSTADYFMSDSRLKEVCELQGQILEKIRKTD